MGEFFGMVKRISNLQHFLRWNNGMGLNSRAIALKSQQILRNPKLLKKT
jgi:hypothetical protein